MHQQKLTLDEGHQNIHWTPKKQLRGLLNFTPPQQNRRALYLPGINGVFDAMKNTVFLTILLSE